MQSQEAFREYIAHPLAGLQPKLADVYNHLAVSLHHEHQRLLAPRKRQRLLQAKPADDRGDSDAERAAGSPALAGALEASAAAIRLRPGCDAWHAHNYYQAAFAL